MNTNPPTRKIQLPGSRSGPWLSRYPRDRYGFTRGSIEGRLIAYLEANVNRAFTCSELMDACQIYSKERLFDAIRALREVIELDPKHPVYLMRVGKSEGYILRDLPPHSSHPSAAAGKLTS